MAKTILYNVTVYLSIAITLVVAAACSASDDMPIDNPDDGGAVKVVAEVARQLYSRGYQEKGDVKDGTYYLSYPLASGGSYNVATVNFGVQDANPQIGFVTLPENQELKWTDVGGGSIPKLYLDNVAPSLASGNADQSDPTRIVFDPDSPDKNPYKADVFDDKEGTNDLLWGSVEVARNVKTVNFDLHHNMARIRVEIQVDRTNEAAQGDLDLDNATVEISSINQVPKAYNRSDGILELNTDLGNYTPLTLVNNDGDWKTIDKQKDVYITKDFVLPPQELLGDVNRPRLTIRLKNGNEYSGILPHAMEIVGQNASDPTTPAALSFLKEHILTIRTVITEEPPTLLFMPVWVVEWVDKGRFTTEAHQSGIYTANEFYKLIEYYNAGNEYQLVRYGRLVEDENTGKQIWVFDFFHSVILDYNSIAGKMQPSDNPSDNKKDFSFHFNNFTNFYKNGSEEPVKLTEQSLYNIVTGKQTTP